MSEIWEYSADARYEAGTDLIGYQVEATDGHIGKIDSASHEVGGAYPVVNTKPWLIGKYVVLPAAPHGG
ncbi:MULTISPECIES: hypothetical protein [Streptomyces]|uniref:hypothetical protein n=1 Tax=Streptomyces TaxID=1883 RepID=UPI00164DC55D|nr:MULTISPECIES: hypothetical protein [Streptomyces]MCZ4098505.1 hypothetical protein [Streptomyces sp. H39-C1]